MKTYIKNYKNRIGEIAITVFCSVMSLLFVLCLFAPVINAINKQLKTYNDADYEYIYLLNYKSGMANEFIYPDTNISIYLDRNRNTRLTVSSLMVSNNELYDLKSFDIVRELNSHQIVLPMNVASQYKIKNGDVLFVEYPYKNELCEVTAIIRTYTEYEITNPVVENKIGQVLLGYDANYEKNIGCQYLIFSSTSRADELSRYPQIINNVINKADNQKAVFRQGLHILLFEFLLTIITLIFDWRVFISKSWKYLRRYSIKGFSRKQIHFIPFFEVFVFIFLPLLICELILNIFIPLISIFSILVYVIPICGVIMLYLLVCIKTVLEL